MFDRAAVSDEFLDAIRKSSDLFLQLQENVIENNLHYFYEPLNPGDQKDLAEIQRQVAEHFIETYKVSKLIECSRIYCNFISVYSYRNRERFFFVHTGI
jgi:hypothetical protein